VRLNNAYDELSHFKSFDYLVINDNLDHAATELNAIIVAERCRRDRRTKVAEDILRTFRRVKEVNDYGESGEQ
jgi:guanylate kinase